MKDFRIMKRLHVLVLMLLLATGHGIHASLQKKVRFNDKVQCDDEAVHLLGDSFQRFINQYKELILKSTDDEGEDKNLSIKTIQVEDQVFIYNKFLKYMMIAEKHCADLLDEYKMLERIQNNEMHASSSAAASEFDEVVNSHDNK